jgi:phosphatidylserine/phosphatidylglycerophosphate/cardiolipin synthase-like enzyme
VVEASQISATGSDVGRLLEAGLDIRMDSNPNLMHHKTIIVDRETVILGSYNFTRSAEAKNDENLLIFHNPPFIDQFLIEFERISQSAIP